MIAHILILKMYTFKVNIGYQSKNIAEGIGENIMCRPLKY